MRDALELFNNYYERFDSSIWGVSYKYEHTMRVVEYCREIAESIGLSKEDIELAELCGLFHDIARFKQYQEYHTFEDKISFDHGDEGYNILKELGVDNEIILESTKWHNKYAVGDVDERTKIFCDITRDADKLDIMMTQENKCNDEEYDVPDDIINALKNKELTRNSGKKSSNATNILRCIGFIFDINFNKSLLIIKDTDIVNIKFDVILNRFDNEDIKKIKDICNKYIDERISG